MSKRKPKPDPIRRLVLATIPEGVRNALENGPPEAYVGIPTFTKDEYAQARRDSKRMSELYHKHGGFVRGMVLSRQHFLTEVLEREPTDK